MSYANRMSKQRRRANGNAIYLISFELEGGGKAGNQATMGRQANFGLDRLVCRVFSRSVGRSVGRCERVISSDP